MSAWDRTPSRANVARETCHDRSIGDVLHHGVILHRNLDRDADALRTDLGS